MMRLPLAALAVLGLPAQVRDNGYVEVTVSRQLQPGASEAVFDVNADVPASTGLAQVAAKLEAVGVRAEHLTRADSTFRFPVLRLGVAEPARFSYSFQIRVPAARLEPLSLEMDQLFRKPPPPLAGFSFSGHLEPSAAAVEAARLAALPSLFEEARAKAEASLAAAGQSPGPVLALSDEVTPGGGAFATVRLTLRMSRQAPSSGSASYGRSVSAVVTRTIPAPFDTASISLGFGGGSEEALRLLAPLGVTAADLESQSSNLFVSGPNIESGLNSNSRFQLMRPAAELLRFLAALAKLETSGLSFSASLVHSRELRTREQEKALPAMLEEARRRAEPLARLLNLPLGNPRSIADTQSAGGPVGGFAFLLLGNARPLFVPQGFFLTGSAFALAVEFAVD